MTHAQQARPEAVMNPVQLGGLAAAMVTSVGGVVLIVLDGVTGDELTPLGVAVGGAVTAVAAFAVYISTQFAGKAAREQVTPLSDPRDADGERLVPISQVQVVTTTDGPPSGAPPTSIVEPDEVDPPGQHAADR